MKIIILSIIILYNRYTVMRLKVFHFTTENMNKQQDKILEHDSSIS